MADTDIVHQIDDPLLFSRCPHRPAAIFPRHLSSFAEDLLSAHEPPPGHPALQNPIRRKQRGSVTGPGAPFPSDYTQQVV